MGFAVVDGKYFDSRLNSVDIRNVMVQGKKITGVGYIPDEDEDAITIVDASKSILVPMVSDFVHMPVIDDFTDTIELVNQSGVQRIAFLPNSKTSCLDSADELKSICAMIPEDDQGNIVLIASSTIGNLPDQMANLDQLIESGASAIYFDRIIENQSLFSQALDRVYSLGVPIIFGPMTTLELNQAHLNAGVVSFEIGVRGESILEEDRLVQFVLDQLTRDCPVPVHFQALSSPKSIELIHVYNSANNAQITVGISPFHCLLSDQLLLRYNSNLKFNPPLRDVDTQSVLNQMVSDGFVHHVTALHSPIVGDIQDTSFYSASFGGATIDSFIDAASHVFIQNEIKLDAYQLLLRIPDQLNLFSKKGTIALNSPASFSVVGVSKDRKKHRHFFDSGDMECFGGLVASVKDGTLFK